MVMVFFLKLLLSFLSDIKEQKKKTKTKQNKKQNQEPKMTCGETSNYERGLLTGFCYLKQSGNKTVTSWLPWKQSNYCLSVAEKAS